MKRIKTIFLIIILLLPAISCGKVKDYFRDPETEQLTETIHAAMMVGYAANLAMALMNGESFPNVDFSRSNAGFPCTTLMVIDTKSDTSMFLAHEKASKITIAGLWPDESTAILSLILTNYHIGTATLDLLGIRTIPVIREADHINIALANMDIDLNPDQDALLQLNLNTLEVQQEIFRLQMPRPTDEYVAIQQDAYFIDMCNNSTGHDIRDDTFTLTGGGQLIEVRGPSAEITQLAMVAVQISPVCLSNPMGGTALMKVTGVEDKGFPELGTAILEFKAGCSGLAHVLVATGMYIGSNGSNVSFHL